LTVSVGEKFWLGFSGSKVTPLFLERNFTGIAASLLMIHPLLAPPPSQRFTSATSVAVDAAVPLSGVRPEAHVMLLLVPAMKSPPGVVHKLDVLPLEQRPREPIARHSQVASLSVGTTWVNSAPVPCPNGTPAHPPPGPVVPTEVPSFQNAVTR